MGELDEAPKHEIQVIGKNIPAEEPLFLIRAQDEFAPAALDEYANLLDDGAEGLEGLDGPDTLSDQLDLRDQALRVRALANKMRRWQIENRDRVKRPD